MPKSRNRSGVPARAALAGLTDAELQMEADRVRLRLGAPLSPLVHKLILKKRHAVQAEQARRAS